MKLLLDALQADNQSGTGTYVKQLLGRLPQLPEIAESTAIARPQTTAPGWELKNLPRYPRITSFYRRHVVFGRYIDAVKPDLVHFPANFGTFFPIRSQHRPAIVTTLHDLTYFVNPKWFPARRALFYQVMARRSAGQSDVLIADSVSTATDLQTRLQLPEQRIQIVPLGCSGLFEAATPEQKREIRARYGLPQSFFLFVGTIEPRKNLPRIIRAWNSIADSCGCDLVIAGREGWKTSAYRRALRNGRWRDRIHAIGFVPNRDLPALISAATAFVWPSLYEGFGLPPLDAMACGVPVLTSASSSLPEVAGGAALLVDPEDERAIAQGMLRLLRDEKLRDALIRKGRLRAEQLTWANTVEKTLQAYRLAMELRR